MPTMLSCWRTSAIKKTGSTPEQIRNGIEQTQKLSSISGIFNMSPRTIMALISLPSKWSGIVKGDWSMLK